ncbi:MAG: M48 family metallopeptidase, partial [Clostridia bacterium]
FRVKKGAKPEMNSKQKLPPLSNYRHLEGSMAESTQSAKEALPSLHAYAKTKGKLVEISPLKNGSGASISSESRSRALRFAHPVDTAVISTMDNAVINTVFNKLVQTNIDATYGLTLASGIHISQNTYADLYAVIVECADSLHIPIPYCIISDSVHGINACTAGTDQFAFIAISSMLPLVMSREELKFVIGHECGHLALGHVVYHTAISMLGSLGSFIPLVGPIIAKTISYPLNAWSRRSEVSADRAGLICCGDIHVAKRALFKLEAGFLNIDDVDIDEYVRESESVLDHTAIGKYTEINRQHPIIPKRIKALKLFAKSETYALAGGTAPIGNLISESQLKQETEEIIEIM